MSGRGVRILFVVFFLGYAGALTWPGLLPFNRIRPFVLGVPFSLVWVALWVIGGFVVFLITDRVLDDGEQHGDSGDAA